MTISNGTLALIAGVGLLAYVGSQNSPAAIARRQQLLQIQNRAPLYRAGGNLLSSIASSILGGGGSVGGGGQPYGAPQYGYASPTSGVNYSNSSPLQNASYYSSGGQYSGQPNYTYA